MTRCRVAVLAVVLVLTTACGVSTEDTPQIVDDSPSQSPEPTPSLDTESPTTSVSVTTATREPS